MMPTLRLPAWRLLLLYLLGIKAFVYSHYSSNVLHDSYLLRQVGMHLESFTYEHAENKTEVSTHRKRLVASDQCSSAQTRCTDKTNLLRLCGWMKEVFHDPISGCLNPDQCCCCSDDFKDSVNNNINKQLEPLRMFYSECAERPVQCEEIDCSNPPASCSPEKPPDECTFTSLIPTSAQWEKHITISERHCLLNETISVPGEGRKLHLIGLGATHKKIIGNNVKNIASVMGGYLEMSNLILEGGYRGVIVEHASSLVIIRDTIFRMLQNTEKGSALLLRRRAVVELRGVVLIEECVCMRGTITLEQRSHLNISNHAGVQTTVTLKGNHGSRDGGGILIHGSSVMVGSGAQLVVDDNSAMQYGGGIFVQAFPLKAWTCKGENQCNHEEYKSKFLVTGSGSKAIVQNNEACMGGGVYSVNANPRRIWKLEGSSDLVPLNPSEFNAFVVVERGGELIVRKNRAKCHEEFSKAYGIKGLVGGVMGVGSVVEVRDKDSMVIC